MLNKPYIPVSGTWGRGKNLDPHSWFLEGSRFDLEMESLGYERHCRPDGYWHGGIGGLTVQRLAPWIDAREAWKEGADVLNRYLVANASRCTDGVTLIAHSHGGQVVAIALSNFLREYQSKNGRGTASLDFPIHVVTIDMPVRVGRWTEMDADYRDALLCATSWTHGYSERGWGSRMRWLGNRFGSRTMPAPARNLEIAGGHSGILSDPLHVHQIATLLDRG